MTDLQTDLRSYIEHLADLAEQDERSQTAPIPRQHPRPPRSPRPILVLAAVGTVAAVIVGWIALDGGGKATTISTPPESKATEPTSPSSTVVPLPPTDALWDAMADCETGGNWAATGQKYQGGLGIYSANWEHYGGLEFAPIAGQATREQQIVVAERIRAEHGLGAWGCAVALGFVQTPDAYVDKNRGFSATIPAGWDRQQRLNKSELLRATSLELVDTCGGTAVTSAGWVTVKEVSKASSPEPELRPAVFDATSGTGSSAPSACKGDIPISTTQSIVFIERGRRIQVTLNFYPGASLANRAEAFELLNSMRIKRARRG